MTRLRSMQAAVVAATTAACIIPDRDIRLEVEEPDNRSTIRIVEPSRLSVRRTLDKLGILPGSFYRWYGVKAAG